MDNISEKLAVLKPTRNSLYILRLERAWSRFRTSLCFIGIHKYKKGYHWYDIDGNKVFANYCSCGTKFK